MRKSQGKIHLGLLFLVVAIGAGTYYYFYIAQPCSRPIYYKVGTVDSRFGISAAQVLSEAQLAADVWNKAAGKKLLVYSADGSLPIDLVYDERQREALRHQALNVSITQQKQTLNTIDANYQQLLTAYNDLKAKYEAAVAYWNARGGAPKDIYDQLQAERQTLNSYADKVNAAAKTANSKVAEVNTIVNEFNSLSGQILESGVYKSTALTQEIDIYQFDNRDDLEFILAHEMGHALGLNHVANPQAVMSAERPLENPTKPVLTADDISALRTLCHLSH